MYFEFNRKTLLLIVVLLLLWGMIGGSITNSSTYTCDIGTGDLCWTWHKNMIGEIADLFRG